MFPPSLATRSWISLLVTALLVIALVPGAFAQPSSDEVRRDLEAVRARLEQIDEQRGQAVDAYNNAQDALDQANAELDAIREQIATLEHAHEDLTGVVEQHVRRLHKMGPGLELSAIVAANDPTEAGTKAATVRRILEGQRTDLEALSANQTEIDAAEARLVDAQQDAAARAAQLEQQHTEIDALFAATEDEAREAEALLADTIEREEEERRLREEEERLRREAEAELRRQQEREAERRAEEERTQRRLAQQREAEERAARQAAEQQPEPTRERPAEQRPETPDAPESSPQPAPSTRSSADVAVQTALAQLGKPYLYGGGGPNSFDCSGLVSYAWRAAGVTLPRSSSAQHAALRSVSRDQLQPGDLVFYHSPVSHVAMYIGDGRVVEAPNSGGVVRIREDGLTRRGVVGFGRP